MLYVPSGDILTKFLLYAPSGDQKTDFWLGLVSTNVSNVWCVTWDGLEDGAGLFGANLSADLRFFSVKLTWDEADVVVEGGIDGLPA